MSNVTTPRTPRGSRVLIVCMDGTENNRDKTDPVTNVARIQHFIAATDRLGRPQVTHYIQGVGTGDESWLDRKQDSATGKTLGARVINALTFLASRYQPGDEIYLIGFSRGAFTARVVAQWLYEPGLFAPAWGATNQAKLAQVYTNWVEASEKGESFDLGDQAAGLRSRIPVRACAVWDTVAEIRAKLLGKRLEFVGSKVTPNIAYAIQALALDEGRINFQPEVWKEYSSGQSLKQCWFRGYHSDIGGGKGSNSDNNFANVSLVWMCTQLAAAGLYFDFQADHWTMLKKLLFHPMYTQIKAVDLDKKKIPLVPKGLQGSDPRSQLPTSRGPGWYLMGLLQGQVRAIERKPGNGCNETIHWSVANRASEMLFCQKLTKPSAIRRETEVNDGVWWTVKDTSARLRQERMSFEERMILCQALNMYDDRKDPTDMWQWLVDEVGGYTDVPAVEANRKLSSSQSSRARQVNGYVNPLKINHDGPYQNTKYPDAARYEQVRNQHTQQCDLKPIVSRREDDSGSEEEGNGDGDHSSQNPSWARTSKKSEALQRRYGGIRHVGVARGR